MSHPDTSSEALAATYNSYTGGEVMGILRKNQWIGGEVTPEIEAWCGRAAAMLGHHATTPEALEALVRFVFHYDANEILATREAHAVLTRHATRDVIRQLSLLLLEPAPFDSERFKAVVTELRDSLEVRSRDLFHPIRLVLAGKAGEGELDRVILLLDEAAALPFGVPVKSVRSRILEFCSALI